MANSPFRDPYLLPKVSMPSVIQMEMPVLVSPTTSATPPKTLVLDEDELDADAEIEHAYYPYGDPNPQQTDLLSPASGLVP